MALKPKEFTLHLAWAVIYFPETIDKYLLPVDECRIMAKPISQGSVGETVVTDVNNVTHYRCEGWRHDVELRYAKIPKVHHDTFLTVVQQLHNTGGEAQFAPASSDGSIDDNKVIDTVAKFDDSTIGADFAKRMRKRGASLMLQGKDLQTEPYDWLTE